MSKNWRCTAATFSRLHVWFVMPNALFRLEDDPNVSKGSSLFKSHFTRLNLAFLSMEASFWPFEHHREGWMESPGTCCDSRVETALLKTFTPPTIPVHRYLEAHLR